MVILDGARNGYRSLLLPLAAQDELARRAVTSIAACHLHRDDPVLRSAALVDRAKVVERLAKASTPLEAKGVFCASTWATVLILLIGEFVLGGDHFPFFVKMLSCLREHGISDASPEMTQFIDRQTEL